MNIKIGLLAFLLTLGGLKAQPVLPTLPAGRMLNYWRFDDTNWLSLFGSSPRSAVNVELTDGVSANAVRFAGLFAAQLPYNLVEPTGRTNLTLQNGSVRFWFRPDFDSGTGPGTYARLLDVGVHTTDGSYGWWSLYLDPFGTNLFFSAQAGGQGSNFLAASVPWSAWEWHQIALTYSPSNSTLYVDGSAVAVGTGVTLTPSGAVQLATGFALGSDAMGGNLAQGTFDELKTYNYPVTAAQMERFYSDESTLFGLGGFFSMNFSMSLPGFGEGGGGGDTNDFVSVTNVPAYFGLSGSTNLWIEILPPTNNASVLLLHNTQGGKNYQLLARSTVGTNSHWFVQQDILGAESTNVTVTATRTDLLPLQFLAFGVSEDTDGDGLADVWELLVSHTSITNSDTGNTGIPDGYQDPDGDGWTNLEEMRTGTNPLVFNTPKAPPSVVAHYTPGATNVTITWAAARGPVLGYRIFDITFGSTLLGSVGSNILSFVDNSLDARLGDPDYEQQEYGIEAIYDNGNSELSEAQSVWKPELTVNAKLVRGTNGQKYLCVMAWPEDLAKIRVKQSGGSYSEFSRTNFENGFHPVSGSTYNDWQWVQGVGADGAFGCPRILKLAFEGWYYLPDHSHVDLRQILADNLRFALRGATVTEPFSYAHLSASSQYEYASFHRIVWPYAYPIFDPISPLEENFLWRNFAFDQSLFTTNAAFLTGAQPANGANGGVRSLEAPLYQYGGTNNNSQLATNSSGWIYYTRLTSATNAFSDGVLAEAGMSQHRSDDVVNRTVSNGAINLFGLPIDSAMLTKQTNASVLFYQIIGGQSVNFSSENTHIFLNMRQPEFGTNEYYFTSHASVASPESQTFVPPLPGDLDFFSTNTTPFFIISAHEPHIFSGWAKKRITNGDVNKFGYLEQFFDKAFKADTNGNATTNQTGLLSEYGEFFPTEPGRVVLTTKPDIETSEVGQAILNVIHLGVDANHDGVIDRTFAGPDNTSETRPFPFWVNDDSDAGGADLNTRQPNSFDSIINGPRDLEDFARLWISGVPTLPSGYTATLSWTGEGAVTLFNAYEANGGIGYLTNETTAYYQSIATNNGGFLEGYGAAVALLSPSSSYEFPANTFSNGLARHFLFEGRAAGKGQLNFTIRHGDEVIAQSSVFMHLQDVKEMYERANAENVTSGLPPSTLVSRHALRQNLPANSSEEKQMIVFVHGINNTEFDYENTSETMFKRLYWAGYRGQFAAFRWPCAYLPPNIVNPFQYNRGEFYAWKSATAFKDYLTYLDTTPRLAGYTISIIAHSQGNVIASEAIKLGAPFDTYILSQGAVPAHCYDVNAPFLQTLLDAETNSGTASPTPFYATNGGYHGYFSAVPGNLVNFYNTNDFALVSGTTAGIQTNWEENQRTQKPESFVGGPTYVYSSSNQTTVGYYTFSSYTVTDLQEIKSMVARSRSAAVGGQDGLHGVIGSSVDLRSAFGFDKTRPEHSAQFSRNIQNVQGYYDQVLTSFGLK